MDITIHSKLGNFGDTKYARELLSGDIDLHNEGFSTWTVTMLESLRIDGSIPVQSETSFHENCLWRFYAIL